MSTLEYTVSMLEAMPEEKLKEVQDYIQYNMMEQKILGYGKQTDRTSAFQNVILLMAASLYMKRQAKQVNTN